MQSFDKDEKELKEIAVSFLRLRRSIGILGITFPFILFLGCYFLGYCEFWQSSISCYYHTIMRNVFVGVLCVFGIFLFYYKYDTWDNWSTNFAGVCALGIAFSPTHVDGCAACGENSFNSEIVGYIHLGFAGSFFFTLACISLFLFTKTNKKNPDPGKLRRNKIYRICAYAMFTCIVLIGIYFFILQKKFPFLEKGRPVFCLESIALIAFGTSWIVKGEFTLKEIMKPVVHRIVKMFKATQVFLKMNKKNEN